MEILKQVQYRPMSIENQVLVFYALSNRHFSDIEVSRVRQFQNDFLKYVTSHHPEIKAEIKKTGKMTDELAKEIDSIISSVKEQYNYS